MIAEWLTIIIFALGAVGGVLLVVFLCAWACCDIDKLFLTFDEDIVDDNEADK